MKIEIAIPCFNEERTIAKVISDFRKEVSESEIIVYNNCSTDKSAELAINSGAKVVNISPKGKGFVVREIIESSKADIIILVDGDDTYEAKDVHKLIMCLQDGSTDMVIGTRLHSDQKEFRAMHHFGNKVITWILNRAFNTHFTDILSGYRGFNRKFIERVPLISEGFEIETEVMIQALEHGIKIKEVEINYRGRPEGSESKLNTFKDGYEIIITIITMLRDRRPFFVFSLAALVIVIIGGLLWLSGFLNCEKNILFSLFRSLGALLVVLAVGLVLVGLILNTINVRMKELISLLRRKN